MKYKTRHDILNIMSLQMSCFQIDMCTVAKPEQNVFKKSNDINQMT